MRLCGWKHSINAKNWNVSEYITKHNSTSLEECPVSFNHITSLLSNHVGRSICVSSYNFGHNTGVDNSQPFHPMDFELMINDSAEFFRTHFASAHKVSQSRTDVSQHTFPVFVTL